MAGYVPTANSISGKGVVICVSKAINESDKSFLYMCKIKDNRMGQGNPVHLIKRGVRVKLWRNTDLRTEKLRFGEIVRFEIVDNEYLYVGKTGEKKMDIDQIKMGLDFGFNSYRGLSDACPGVEFFPFSRGKRFSLCRLPGKPEKDQIFIIAIASGVIRDENIYLQTINGESVVCKLNCRENSTVSVAPLHLLIRERKEDDVGDVAIIKFIQSFGGPSPTSYTAVCEGLVLRYHPKVISIEEEMVEIMNAEGHYVNCPEVVHFDTRNTLATAISKELVKKLNLEDKIDRTKERLYTGVVKDDDDNPIGDSCFTIIICVKIRKKIFRVEALYDATCEPTGLLIGTDIIEPLLDEGFTLGK